MTCKLLGRIDWSVESDDSWNRTFKIKWLIETDTVLDGPYRALGCPQLPVVGSSWIFGNDNDQYAICVPNMSVARFNTPNEPGHHWTVEQTFTTKWSQSQTTQPVTNPLAMPANVSGTFVKYQEEMRVDKNNKPIKSMSGERIKGEQVKFDANRPTVSIEQNYPELGLNVFAFMIDHVSDSFMWGLPKRCVKLSNIRWTRNVYAFGYFYTRSYDFDINFKTFDRKIWEEGTMRLLAGGNKNKRADWAVVKDKEGNILRNQIYYKSDGSEWDENSGGEPAIKKIEYYPETNLFSLGIPAAF